MRKKRNDKGFTMAELLIVVAIIGVLAGVAFIAVQNHQKSLTQLERDTIAKEIFVAAQNHLTVAKSQDYNIATGEVNYDDTGFFGASLSSYTQKRNSTDASGTPVVVDGVHYLTADAFTTNHASAIDVMLPFGAIDETVRSGGRYTIIYQPQAGVVLDVFYWENDGRFGGSDPDISTLIPLRGSDSDNEAKQNRRNNLPMIGWFGGEGVDIGTFLETPTVKVINEEKLKIEVTDTNIRKDSKVKMQPSLKLIIEGDTSKAKASFLLTHYSDGTSAPVIPMPQENTRLCETETKDDNDNNDVVYTIVLDDITTENMHFADIDDDPTGIVRIEKQGDFIPGENLIVYAVAYSNTCRTSVAYSSEWITNSLFADLRANSDGTNTALISNIRHLENLDYRISRMDDDDDDDDDKQTLFDGKINAEQIRDLDWDAFKRAITGSVSIYMRNGQNTKANTFLPVSSPKYPLIYNGQSVMTTETNVGGVVTQTTEATNHSITGIVVDNTASAAPSGAPAATEVPLSGSAGTANITEGGLFGELEAGSSVKNLELVDFSITLSAGDVGALAGKLKGSTVSNVLARNASGADTLRVSTQSGNAGGLVGSLSGTGNAISNSGAALIVSSASGSAGGLIGTSGGGSVTSCFSGGHTEEGKYAGNATGGNYNVSATGGTAGGLIGAASGTTIAGSYSTCSATGATVGGLVGTASGSVTNCYATGLVRGVPAPGDDKAIEGAFAGTMTGKATNCLYYEIVNERPVEQTTGSGSSAVTTTVGYEYLPPVSPTDSNKTGALAGVSALDASANTYNQFMGPLTNVDDAWLGKDASKDWKAVKQCYDSALGIYFDDQYPLRTVDQLGSYVKEETDQQTTAPADYVLSHYGDWPAPEIFIENVK